MARGSKKLTHPKLVANKQGLSNPAAEKSDRDTLNKLRAHVDDIEKRLKRANKLTRTSVRALQSSYEALDKNMDNSIENGVQVSALTGHIGALSDRLTGMIEQTRRDVAHDLKIVLSDPRLQTLSAAITKANKRLTKAEHNQAEAINTINLHIARLATAVDERMLVEERKRQAADEVLARRLEAVEQDSAQAFKSIGKKIVTITEDMTARLHSHKGEMSEDALARQHEYEEHKHTMAQRIEAIEDERRNQIPVLERGLATLSTRLEALEQCGSFDAGPDDLLAPAYQAAPNIFEADVIFEAEMLESKALEQALPQTSVDAQSNVDVQAKDAFAALALIDTQDVSPPQFVANPDTFEHASSTPVFAPEPAQEDNVSGQTQPPEEFMSGDTSNTAPAPVFSPREYAPHGSDYVAQTSSVPTPYVAGDSDIQEYNPQTSTPPLPSSDVIAPDMPPTAFGTMSGPPPMPDDANLPQSQPRLYPQEAHQEIHQDPPLALAPEHTIAPPVPLAPQNLEIAQEPTMESVRPGADPHVQTRKARKENKRKLKRKNKQSGSGGAGSNHGNIRKLALLAGVAVIALFAYKTIAPKIFENQERTFNAQTPQSRQLANVTMSGETDFAAIDASATNENQNLQPVESIDPPAETATETPVATIAPIGDYTQSMAAPDLGQTVAKANANKLTLETAAANGDAVAQFQLGLAHLEAGRDAEALRLIRLSANQGQAAAQYRLAKLYEAGIGVKVNGKTAKGLLLRAAKADNRIAMHDLGHYYATGADGSAPDIKQAVSWFSKAANRGVLDSQFNLGVLYQGGSGVELSLTDAYFWYTIAGLQGDKIAKQRSEAIEPELSADNLDLAQARIKAFSPTPVNNGANGVFND